VRQRRTGLKLIHYNNIGFKNPVSPSFKPKGHLKPFRRPHPTKETHEHHRPHPPAWHGGVLLTEQLYRAVSILHNHPYHRE